MKKSIKTVLYTVFLLALTSCETANMSQDTKDARIIIHEDGTVTEYLVEAFDPELYDPEEFKQMAQKEAASSEGRLLVKDVSGPKDGLLSVSLQYADMEYYEAYTGAILAMVPIRSLSSELENTSFMQNMAVYDEQGEKLKLREAIQKCKDTRKRTQLYLFVSNVTTDFYLPGEVLYTTQPEGFVPKTGKVTYNTTGPTVALLVK